MDSIIAFKELCKSCGMSIILNEDANASLKMGTDKFGDKVVLTSDNKIYDDRGELYEALNRVACELFPNVLGRERWENDAKES